MDRRDRLPPGDIAGFERSHCRSRPFPIRAGTYELKSAFEQYGTNLVAITLDGLESSGPPTEEEILAFLAPGERVYHDTNDSGTVAIHKGSLQWPASSYWNTQPSTSRFTITDAQPFDDGSGAFRVRVKARFNCTLYRPGNDPPLVVTDGTLVMVFGESD